MQQLSKPRLELERATKAIELFRTCGDLSKARDHWHSYLSHVERCWNKLLDIAKADSCLQAIKGAVTGERRSDELLAYLVNARGAEEHTVADISRIEGPSMRVDAAHGNSLFIDRIEFDGHGNPTISSRQPLRITFDPAKLALLPVRNRGRLYPVPRQHKGEKLESMEIPEIASKGIQYYAEVLDHVERTLEGA